MLVLHGLGVLPLNPIKGPKMKSLTGIVASLLITVGAAHAGEIIVKPKALEGTVVLRLSAGKILDASPVDAGEIAIKPKASDSVVVLMVSADTLVKASVRAKPENMGTLLGRWQSRPRWLALAPRATQRSLLGTLKFRERRESLYLN